MQALSPLLGKTVEFLPARCAWVRKLWLLHPLEHIDLGAGAIHNGTDGDNMTSIRQYDFNLKDLVGQTPLRRQTGTGLGGPHGGTLLWSKLFSEEFKQSFAKHRLQGVVFEQVFSWKAS
jgi:hypothetical protein